MGFTFRVNGLFERVADDADVVVYPGPLGISFSSSGAMM